MSIFFFSSSSQLKTLTVPGGADGLDFRKMCAFYLRGADERWEKTLSSVKLLLVQFSQAFSGFAHVAGLLSGSGARFSVGEKVVRVTQSALVSKVLISLVDVDEFDEILPGIAQLNQRFQEAAVLAQKHRNAEVTT